MSARRTSWWRGRAGVDAAKTRRRDETTAARDRCAVRHRCLPAHNNTVRAAGRGSSNINNTNSSTNGTATAMARTLQEQPTYRGGVGVGQRQHAPVGQLHGSSTPRHCHTRPHRAQQRLVVSPASCTGVPPPPRSSTRRHTRRRTRSRGWCRRSAAQPHAATGP